jgi:hypothetical protein
MQLNLMSALTRALAADEALKPRFKELRQLIAAAAGDNDGDIDEETIEAVEHVRSIVAAEIETGLCPYQLFFIKGAAGSEAAAVLAHSLSQEAIRGGCSAGTHNEQWFAACYVVAVYVAMMLMQVVNDGASTPSCAR